jgi:hypothetical protein
LTRSLAALAAILFMTSLASTSAAAQPNLGRTPAECVENHEDPVGREQLRRDAVEQARGELDGFDKERNLDAQTFERLIQLVANQELERKYTRYRCFADSNGCPADAATLYLRHTEAVEALIGTGGQWEMRKLVVPPADRRMLAALAKRLPADQPLTRAQHEAMIIALDDALRADVEQEVASGQNSAGYIDNDGSRVFYLDLPSTEESVASARIYVQRVKDYASLILHGRQVVIFNQMQDELLSDLQQQLRGQPVPRREGS